MCHRRTARNADLRSLRKKEPARLILVQSFDRPYRSELNISAWISGKLGFVVLYRSAIT